MSETVVIIVAAGSGSRFGGDTPKQFLELDGVPVCVRAARCFIRSFPDAKIVFVLPGDYFDHWSEFICSHTVADERFLLVPGGVSRWESVKNALTALPGSISDSATVMIHDGARPLVDEATVRSVARATVNTDGAVPGVQVVDSLRRIGDDGVSSEPVDRTEFRAVQTPQGSKLWRLRQAYSLPYDESFTDDASVLTAAGFSNIVLVPGSRSNIKITTPEDLKIARCLI